MSNPNSAPVPRLPENYSKLDEIIELVKRLCLAHSTGSLYGVSHPNTVDSIRSAYVWLNRVLEFGGELTLNFAEGRLLVDSIPVEERNPMVAKFAKIFQQIHVDNLVLSPALRFEDFQAFFEILSQGARLINARGGFVAQLQAKQVTTIQSRQISFVMVRDDEKVVKRDDQVVSSQLLGALGSDQQLVSYMVQEILRRAEERQWLITETKNNPVRMAQLISEGIELAVSRSESGLDQGKTIEGLVENIKLVGKSLVEEGTGELTRDDALQEAIVTMENELRIRSKKLMSTETAVGFVNEILNVVTSYSDQIKAKRISDEILKGQRTLKNAERLIKKLAPKGQVAEEYLERIRDLLISRGLTEEQLLRLIRSMRAARRQKRKAAIPAPPIYDHIQRQLAVPVADPAQREQLATELSVFFDRELKQRARLAQTQVTQLEQELDLVGQLLDQTGLGLVVWTVDGRVDFISPAAAKRLGFGKGQMLNPALVASWGKWQFPLASVPPEVSAANGWTDLDCRLLMAVERRFQNPDGRLHGAVLRAAS